MSAPTKQLFDFSVDLLQAILWQYNDATRLQSLLQSKHEWYNQNQRDFWENWFTNVFNLQTCDDFGLTVWAVILDMPIVIQVEPATPSRPAWGFDTPHRNFNRGNFYDGKGGAQVLNPRDARIALRLRYYQLTMRGTVPEINRIMKSVFADYGNAWVEDNNDMTLTYKLGFLPSAALFLVLINNDLFPRPSGVAIDGYINFDYVFSGADEVFSGSQPVINIA